MRKAYTAVPIRGFTGHRSAPRVLQPTAGDKLLKSCAVRLVRARMALASSAGAMLPKSSSRPGLLNHSSVAVVVRCSIAIRRACSQPVPA